MSALTEFLLARIAEDEELLNWGRPLRVHVDPGGNGDATFPFRERWKAECEVKRRVLNAGFLTTTERNLTAAILALPYADHSDYREEWKP